LYYYIFKHEPNCNAIFSLTTRSEYKAETGEFGPNISLTLRWTLETIYVAFSVAMVMCGKCIWHWVEVVGLVHKVGKRPWQSPKRENRSVGLASKMAGSSDSQCKIRVKCAKRAARAEIARKKKGRMWRNGRGLLSVNMLSNSRKDLGF